MLHTKFLYLLITDRDRGRDRSRERDRRGLLQDIIIIQVSLVFAFLVVYLYFNYILDYHRSGNVYFYWQNEIVVQGGTMIHAPTG